MAFNYYGTDSVGTGVRITPTSDSVYLIDQNVTIGSTNSTAVRGTNVTNSDFTILGTLFANVDAFLLTHTDGTSLNNTFNIGATGSIIAEADAIEVHGDALNTSGTTTVNNHGWINVGDDGVYILYQALLNLNNTGIIESRSTSSTAYAVYADTAAVNIQNSGLLQAQGSARAIYINATGTFDKGGTALIVNTGEIRSGLDGHAVYSVQHTDHISNDGYIFGDIVLGAGEGLSSAYNDVLINTGTVVGQISMGYGDNDIENDGIISGDAYLSAGDDVVENTGEMSGLVSLGSGDDKFLGENGIVDGKISGGSGNDIIRSGFGDDLMEGGAGRDRMYGDAGNDTATFESSSAGVRVSLTSNRGRGGDARGDWLFDIENLIGSNYDDTLIGDAMSNILEGGGGGDTLDGEGGNDFLLGEVGDDTLIGGDGDDILNGGLDRDILWGGDGIDIFEFLDVAESGIGSDRDVIKDFEQGVDLIDLSAIGAHRFSAGGFTYNSGEVTYKLIGGGTKTVIEYDHDGDGAADFQLLMTNGGFTMTADDFVLG